MTMHKGLSDEILHAYVDGALSSDERGAVEAHLALHPETAARARAWAAQNETLHALFDPVLDEPHTLKVETRKRVFVAPYFWRNAAALAATLVIGIAIGYFGRDYWTPAAGNARASIARQALLAHAAYVPEVRHPVEVTAREEQHLLAWLSKRLDAPLKAPSLAQSGYQLLGGRLLPAPAGAASADKSSPVALLMYENAQGKRLSLLVRREAPNTDTAFRFTQDGHTSVFYWIDGPFGYALVGDVNKDELAVLARLVHQQLNP
jgi:anti-sigma factor RsiW